MANGQPYPRTGEGSIINVNGQQMLQGPLGFPVPMSALGGNKKRTAAPSAYGQTATPMGANQPVTPKVTNVNGGGRIRQNFAGGGKVAGFASDPRMQMKAQQAQLQSKTASTATKPARPGMTMTKATVATKPAAPAAGRAQANMMLQKQKLAAAKGTAGATGGAGRKLSFLAKGGKVKKAPPKGFMAFTKKTVKGGKAKGNPFAKMRGK